MPMPGSGSMSPVVRLSWNTMAPNALAEDSVRLLAWIRSPSTWCVRPASSRSARNVLPNNTRVTGRR
ncbi:hypothetical protein SAMN05216188_1377 [Lentzea xinjiangensis]|uniref:Uncharacterized protein n=1 Tax=Lentzea xinjiangensis TaxID=402600 RepID=A0A1H9WLY1_9PSEU|nr:hypothetical protein SAMN05216188_1377 [Lentzea xinjiangensis]